VSEEEAFFVVHRIELLFWKCFFLARMVYTKGVLQRKIILEAAVSLKCSSTSAYIQSSTCIGKVGGFLDPLFRNTLVLRASLDAGSNGSVKSVSSKTIRVVCFSALSRVRSGSCSQRNPACSCLPFAPWSKFGSEKQAPKHCPVQKPRSPFAMKPHMATTDWLFLMNLKAFVISSSPSRIRRLGYEIRRLYTQIRNWRKLPAK
jgi:hypothetical protein